MQKLQITAASKSQETVKFDVFSKIAKDQQHQEQEYTGKQMPQAAILVKERMNVREKIKFPEKQPFCIMRHIPRIKKKSLRIHDTPGFLVIQKTGYISSTFSGIFLLMQHVFEVDL